MAVQLKEEGNALLAAKDYGAWKSLCFAFEKVSDECALAAGAEAKYSAAIALSPDTAALHSNRALARFMAGSFAASLEDAERCVALRRDWLKGHFHRVRALVELGRAEAAQAAYRGGCEQANGKESADFVALEAGVATAYIRHHYAPLTAGLNVEVRYIDGEKGKGLFAKEPVRMFRAIFSETPLVSHRKLPEPGAPESCSHCMRFFSSKQEIGKTKLAPFYKDIYPEPPVWLYCSECEKRAPEMTVTDPALVKDPFVRGNPFFLEKYCGSACRDEAWRQYHGCLCGASFLSDEKRVHPLHHLYNVCVESRRSNPLMICRIFGVVFQRIVAGGQTPAAAMQDFVNFVASEEESPVDDMAVFLLKNMFALFPFMEDVVTLGNYRRLNSAILRNAQTVNPVSDAHMWFERALQDEQRYPNLLKQLGFSPDDLKNYMAKPEMTSMCK